MEHELEDQFMDHLGKRVIPIFQRYFSNFTNSFPATLSTEITQYENGTALGILKRLWLGAQRNKLKLTMSITNSSEGKMASPKRRSSKTT